MEKNFSSKICLLTLFIAFGLFSGALNGQDKLTPEEVIAKHLESIGTAEARSAVKSVLIVGTSKAVFRGRGGGSTAGVAVLASEGEKNLIGMKFDNVEYPFEKMGYDGKDFSVGYITPGNPSTLGQFLRINENSFKHGILGGTLSTSWELLDFDQNKAKIKYSGTEKVNGKKLHKLKYEPKKGSDMTITMFFDSETFHHVRTEYKRTFAANIGGGFGGANSSASRVDNSAGQSETRYTLIEEFDDFRTENKLMMPHSYKIYIEILSGNGTATREWTMSLQKFNFNQAIDPKEFRVDSY